MNSHHVDHLRYFVVRLRHGSFIYVSEHEEVHVAEERASGRRETQRVT